MHKTKVLLDMDGVIVDLASYMISEFSKRTGVKYSLESIVEFDVTRSLGIPFSMLDEVLRQDSAFGIEECKPIDGSISAINELLLHDQLDLYIATSPWVSNKNCERKKREWLEYHIPSFPQNKIFFCSDKHMIKADFLIDDRPKTLSLFQYYSGEAIAFSQPWNQNWFGKRIKNLNVFLKDYCKPVLFQKNLLISRDF